MKVKIKEGKSYPFKISGLVVLPNGNECFILIDPNNVKHLLETKYYLNYKLKPGQTINCRIDKINCTGKIFIEPEHPYYKLGEIYEFPLVRIEKKNNLADSNEIFVVFTDVFKNEIKMLSNELTGKFNKNDLYKFRVKKIKKGRLFISSTKNDEDYSGFKVGEEYKFRISQFRNYPDRDSTFILTDTSGKTYELRSKFYADYNLKQGQTIHCTLIKDNGETYLEPRHPKYSPGKEYDFEIIRQDFIDDYPEGKIKVYVLKNDFGKEVYIPVENVSVEKIKLGKIKCRILNIKKSRLYLEC